MATNDGPRLRDVPHIGNYVVYTENELKPVPLETDLESVSEFGGPEPYIPSDNEITHQKQNSYATRTLFVILIVSGIVLIGTGVGLLIMCRNDVGKITCDMSMDRQPCSPLATSTYLGCAVVLATVFGFGCVGRKAMACLLLCILLTEMTFGIYLIVKKKDALSVQLEAGLVSAQDKCVAVASDEDLRNYVDCWENLMAVHVDCLNIAQNVLEQCNDGNQEKNLTDKISLQETGNGFCAESLNNKIIENVWAQLFIEGPILIVFAPIHLLIAAWLWLMRFTQSSLKYEMRLKSAVSSCLSRKMSETPTQPDSHFDSLIIEPPEIAIMNKYGRVASQKYIIKKLQKQKNMYNTV